MDQNDAKTIFRIKKFISLCFIIWPLRMIFRVHTLEAKQKLYFLPCLCNFNLIIGMCINYLTSTCFIPIQTKGKKEKKRTAYDGNIRVLIITANSTKHIK